MRKILLKPTRKGSIFLTLLIGLVFGHSSYAQLVQTAKTSASGRGYIEYLPPDYATNPTKTYPVIFFLHGAGEVGNGTPAAMEKIKTAGGPPKEISNGNNMCFTVNGVQECFIVISPQLNDGPGGWWPSILEPFFNDILNNSTYRIDKTRVYLTGLSLGGQGVYIGLGQTPDVFAAAAVVAGFDNGNGCTISSRKIAVWGFHGESDGTIPYGTGLANFNNIVNCTSPVPTAELKWTSYSGVGHNSWDRAFSSNHTYQSPLNIYEWLLTKSKVLGNANPVVSAGANKSITLPTNSTTLTGSATDSDGTIASYAWTQVSGPNTATLGNANTVTVSMSNLVAGVYTMRLTATDNAGGSSNATATVTVNATAPNSLPVVSAGANKSITLPTNSTTLTGSATDSDGTIASYAWTQVSGPNTATLANTNTVTVSMSNLVAGVYTMRLTATDNAGGSSNATATVTVNAAAGAGTNIALGKSVVVSSTEAWLGAQSQGSNAVDGVSNTRWSSAFADPQWLQVDLGSVYSINRVQITWETACASNYEIQVSNDASNWSSIKTVVGNSVLLNNHTGLSGSGRYIRMYGTTRFTEYSYSIFEFEVYGTTPNVLPVANAGVDRVVQLPATTLAITGTATDSDGTISSYSWTKISGPAATLANANTATLSLSSLVAGTYVFRLTATDNLGGTGSDDVTVTVNAAPVANAGVDRVVQLPATTLAITGTATDSDGTISSYSWTKISGPAATLTNANTATLSLSSLVAGTYVFRLTATDNLGGTGSDDVTVTVNAAPVANAGVDRVVQLPATTLAITGTATDSDGTISSYSWTKISGPSATLANANTAILSLSELVVGTYVFRLTVTDNLGGSGSDDVTVTVNAASGVNAKPVVNAGPDQVFHIYGDDHIVSGTATDSDGTIESYLWTKVSGPSISLSVTDTPDLIIPWYGSKGTYVFRLTATDNLGETSYDDVTVILNSRPGVNVGNDQTINSNYSNTMISTTASDSDGTIASFTFEQVSGPNTATIENTSTSGNTRIYKFTGFVAGTYVLKGTAVDDRGATSSMNVNIFVNAIPVAITGPNQTIQLPTNSATLTGSATDSDGIIVSYQWSYQSGPPLTLPSGTPGDTFTAPSSSPNVTITGLVAGTYLFRLHARDNLNALGVSDLVTIQVNPASPVIPTNIALNKPVYVSSTEAWLGTQSQGSNAVDGVSNTRWASAQEENQWIFVDFGSVHNVSKVKILWEAALAENYTIDYYATSGGWYTLKTITGNTSLTNEHDVNVTTRHIRITGTKRGTSWGYSIYELEVYGSPVTTSSSGRTSSDLSYYKPEQPVEGEASLEFLDKTYTGGQEYDVVIFTTTGTPIYKGKWRKEVYDELAPNKLYIYHILRDGKRIDAGKMILKR